MYFPLIYYIPQIYGYWLFLLLTFTRNEPIIYVARLWINWSVLSSREGGALLCLLKVSTAWFDFFPWQVLNIGLELWVVSLVLSLCSSSHVGYFNVLQLWDIGILWRELMTLKSLSEQVLMKMKHHLHILTGTI